MRWISLGMLVGCGGGDGPVSQRTIEDACDQSCGRFDECGLFGGFFTLEQCLDQCTVQLDPSDDPDCEVSDSQARACADA